MSAHEEGSRNWLTMTVVILYCTYAYGNSIFKVEKYTTVRTVVRVEAKIP